MRNVLFAVLSPSVVFASTEDSGAAQVHSFTKADEDAEYPRDMAIADDVANTVSSHDDAFTGLVRALDQIRDGFRLTRALCIQAFSPILLQGSFPVEDSDKELLEELRLQLDLPDRSSVVQHFLSYNIPEVRSIIKAIHKSISLDGLQPSKETVTPHLHLLTDLLSTYSRGKRDICLYDYLSSDLRQPDRFNEVFTVASNYRVESGNGHYFVHLPDEHLPEDHNSHFEFESTSGFGGGAEVQELIFFVKSNGQWRLIDIRGKCAVVLNSQFTSVFGFPRYRYWFLATKDHAFMSRGADTLKVDTVEGTQRSVSMSRADEGFLIYEMFPGQQLTSRHLSNDPESSFELRETNPTGIYGSCYGNTMLIETNGGTAIFSNYDTRILLKARDELVKRECDVEKIRGCAEKSEAEGKLVVMADHFNQRRYVDAWALIKTLDMVVPFGTEGCWRRSVDLIEETVESILSARGAPRSSVM